MIYELGTFRKIPLLLIIPRELEQRLASTCFRAGDAPRAGNFHTWRSARDMFADRFLFNAVREEVIEYLKDPEEPLEHDETFSITIKHPQLIGWSSTAPFDDVPLGQLEPYAPNKHSTVLMVQRDSLHLAPVTKEITIVMSTILKQQRSRFIVRTMYPGPDIGPLSGDLTERERIVMFGWQHPGAPIA